MTNIPDEDLLFGLLTSKGSKRTVVKELEISAKEINTSDLMFSNETSPLNQKHKAYLRRRQSKVNFAAANRVKFWLLYKFHKAFTSVLEKELSQIAFISIVTPQDFTLSTPINRTASSRKECTTSVEELVIYQPFDFLENSSYHFRNVPF